MKFISLVNLTVFKNLVNLIRKLCEFLENLVKMFSLFSYLWRRRKSDPEASERNEIEVERKIEEILDKLNSKSSGNGYDERVIHIPSQADNEIIKCSKLEGECQISPIIVVVLMNSLIFRRHHES